MGTEQLLDALTAEGLGNRIEDREGVAAALKGMDRQDWEKIWEQAELHQIWGVIWQGIQNFPEAQAPGELSARFEKACAGMAYQYYYILSFTTYAADLLEKAGIRCMILKGIPLNMLYPREEMRKISAADIYVPDPEEFRQADRLLLEKGFRREQGFAAFHNGYTKEMGGRTCLLELHRTPCDRLADPGAEKRVGEVFAEASGRPDICQAPGARLLVLPAAENGLQLLLHMLQHFLHEGFGLRLLCDWTVFWQKQGTEKDMEKFCGWAEETGLAGFAGAVTGICAAHLGMDPALLKRLRDPRGTGKSLFRPEDEALYRDIISGGEFGRGEKSRLVILKDRSLLGSMFREVHNAMKFYFPRGKKYPAAWPVLWAGTILIFLRNNKRLGRGGTAGIIQNAKARTVLMKQLSVFEKKGRKKK